MHRTIRTLAKPAPVQQGSTDKRQGILLLTSLKEVIVLSKKVLEACPPAKFGGACKVPEVPPPPPGPAPDANIAPAPASVKLSRLLYVLFRHARGFVLPSASSGWVCAYQCSGFVAPVTGHLAGSMLLWQRCDHSPAAQT